MPLLALVLVLLLVLMLVGRLDLFVAFILVLLAILIWQLA